MSLTRPLAQGAVPLDPDSIDVREMFVRNPRPKSHTLNSVKTFNRRDLEAVDVQQMFGRAGRPQFDSSGEGIIITTAAKLTHFLGMVTCRLVPL